VRLDSIRRSLIGSVFALAAVLLGSCGGGGAGSTNAGGILQLLPSSGTFYAGVEYTFTVSGGRPPYTLSSSEPSLFAVPTTLNGNSFTVVPNNPGVIDADIPPGGLNVRTVFVTVRDSTGGFIAAAEIQVAQNFLTGYGVFFNSNCAAEGVGVPPPAACAGGTTEVVLNATISGNLNGNREYRFDVLRGPFTWFFPSGQLQGGSISADGSSVTTRTDHAGRAHVWLRVSNNVGTQLAAFRVTDVATGVSTTHVFIIQGVPLTGELEVIPDEITFTGPTTAQCGTGSADVLVFDGTPPYTAVSSFGSILVTPSQSNSQPGRFTITASNPFICITDGAVVISDAHNNRATVTVTTEAGSADPPPPAISLTPQSVTLQCGSSGSVSIIGGDGTFSTSSADARITATIADRTLTVSRGAADVPPILPASPTPGTENPIQFQVTVTDGNTVGTLSVRAPSHCPP